MKVNLWPRINLIHPSLLLAVLVSLPLWLGQPPINEAARGFGPAVLVLILLLAANFANVVRVHALTAPIVLLAALLIPGLGAFTGDVRAAAPSVAEKQPADAVQNPADGESREVATVLGQAIRSTNTEEVKEVIITQLFKQYADQHGIVAEEPEIDTWVSNLDRAMRIDKTLTATDAENLSPEEKA